MTRSCGWGRANRFGLSTLALSSVWALNACNAFDEPISDGPRTLRVVPTDEREVVSSATPLKPVSGGTLLSLTATGQLAISDPDRDQVSVTGKVTELTGTDDQATPATVNLGTGAEPGRMASISDTNFAVVLRGTGEVASIDAANVAESWRSAVCSAPRGIAFEAGTGQLHVACAEGVLVSLDAATGTVQRRLTLDPDLRDVVVADGRLYVSRFRAAEVLFIDDGQLTQRVSLPAVRVQSAFSGRERLMQSTVAWRMQASPLGGVAVVHERATLDEVPVNAEQAAKEAGSNADSTSAYGGAQGNGCDGIVQVALTQVNADGSRSTSASLAGITLPVDFTFSPDSGSFIVADAGLADLNAPKPEVRVVSAESASPSVGVAFASQSIGIVGFTTAELTPLPAAADGSAAEAPLVPCTFGTPMGSSSGPATAVAYAGDTLIAQNAQPNTLSFQDGRQVSLHGDPLQDSAHDVFHRDSGAGLACASCHPEGTSDGHVWKFTDVGLRRTQDLAVPLAETLPFHWDGTLEDVGAIMDQVFVQRMGGVFQSPERLAALSSWLNKAPKAVSSAALGSEDAAARGKALFRSKEVGCATCHSGKAFTDNNNYYVGTTDDGVELQVPSLVGIAARPPFMHDGCAVTLRNRFDPKCGGGDEHGHTSQLSDGDLGDLVAYLQTL